MKRIGRSKVPYAHQLASMAENLAKKYNRTVYSKIENITYNFESKLTHKTKYELYFVPGFDGKNCTSFSYTIWPELLDKYFSLMKESVNDK